MFQIPTTPQKFSFAKFWLLADSTIKKNLSSIPSPWLTAVLPGVELRLLLLLLAAWCSVQEKGRNRSLPGFIRSMASAFCAAYRSSSCSCCCAAAGTSFSASRRSVLSVSSLIQQIRVGDLWHFGADPDPHLWLMDPDPTPDPTPFFSAFKDAKKIPFFSFNLPTGT